MKMVNTFGTDFVGRSLKNDRNTLCIYARVTVNGETKEISLKTLVDRNDWDPGKEMIVGKDIEVKAANEYIDNVRFRLKEHYRALEDKQLIISAQDVKDAFLGVRAVQNQDHTLLGLITYHFEQMADKLKPGTLKNYYATAEYVKQFIRKKFRRDDLYLVQLNYQFITEFETYIPKNPIKTHDKCTANGTAKHIERLKKMVKWAKTLQWIKTNPFEDFSPHRVTTKKPKLPMTAFMDLEKATLQDEKLNFVKDIFIFACYTGLAYADLMAIRPEDFITDSKGKIWCTYHRQKSEEAAAIPLLATALEILNRYKNNPRSIERGTIFPYLSNQDVNRSLKIIQEIFGIAIKMTFHLARHTFATTMMLKSGVPLETVSKMLGHSKISTTQVYAEVDEEKIEQDMAPVEQRLMERKNLLKAV